jgi:hypothetical protein
MTIAEKIYLQLNPVWRLSAVPVVLNQFLPKLNIKRYFSKSACPSKPVRAVLFSLSVAAHIFAR